ncbi:hypothetical protein SH501x_001123 [Pirellulaceae bacterium SH501]
MEAPSKLSEQSGKGTLFQGSDLRNGGDLASGLERVRFTQLL